MERATKVIRSGAWDRSREQGRITLPFVDRHRRRLVLRADGGMEFLLDLAETTALRAGDGLELESGAIVVVRAADEDLYEVIARSPAELGRLAWHLGNRHLPAQIERERILIRADHVIADMLRGLGASVRAISAPFDPESGAYSGAHGHDHAHDHDHAHEHARGRVR